MSELLNDIDNLNINEKVQIKIIIYQKLLKN